MLCLKIYNVVTLLSFAWLTMSLPQSSSSPAEKAYEQLVNIVKSSPKPKGIPFADAIPSPKNLNCRIGIVGAGPAGIHMAYLLKKKGFNNIVVLEKSDGVGGKSYTVKHRNVLHEMGTCYTQPDYEDNVIAMAKDFGLWEPIDLPSANVWLDQFQSPVKYSYYVIGEVMKILGTRNQTIAQGKLLLAMINYSVLHRQLFGKYDGELMRKPAPSTMKILKCTFGKFLAKYNLEVLKPIFIASHTVQGYGHLDEISALYGLMWNTPNFVKSLAGKLIGKDHGLSMIRGGYQELWKTIKNRENIDVRFNTRITKLYRKYNKVLVKTQRQLLKFDFLIWTPSLYSNLGIIHASQKEREIFSKLKPVWFTTTLFDSAFGIRGLSPIDYWISNVENKREHSVWAQRDSYGVLNNLYGRTYRNGSLPGGPDGRFIRTGVAYQYGKKPASATKIKNRFYQNFKKIKASGISVLKQITWEYFPKFSPQEMADGVLWDIFELQGSRRTWFAGSSVSFESVKSVLEYNKLLVSKMT